jgi:hypothetical protein
LPTNNNQNGKKVLVNGKEEAPVNKTKLPPDVDWQAMAREKQEQAGER